MLKRRLESENGLEAVSEAAKERRKTVCLA
jgi:hypothetical protein